MKSVLIILNDPPYGTERSYNGLRLAGALARSEGTEVRVFLLGDAVGCARRGQKVPTGYYNIEMMLKAVTRHGGSVGACGTCMEARGMNEPDLAEGVHRGSLDELTAWTAGSERVINF